ncbi:MAG: PD-(D/E)XK nuclease family transposase [Lachnospiraceae bacterium]|nr:PD-(D/E)XK nuclease family transposase [Lachnospiraceae bacterium]
MSDYERRTDEEVAELVAGLKGISDVFFERLINDPGVCEEFLQTVLEMPRLRIKPETLVPQKSIKFIANRSVRVDAYIEDETDRSFNIEVQRANDCDHIRRARYNASAITIYKSEPGDEFKDVQEVYVIYLTEDDFLKEGRTIYHAEMVIRETGKALEDGLHEVFVNTQSDDGSKIARLMALFEKTEVDDPEFPNFTRRFNEVKNDREEGEAMCREVEAYAEKRAAKAAAEAAIKQVIQTCFKHNISEKKIIVDLMVDHHLTEDEAKAAIEKYR